jgi:AcrR family transcriptional regulator
MDPQVQKGGPVALTTKGAATRRRIVDGAAELMRERGVADTRLDDVMARTGTSKSQLFHYFPDGREQLLLAVARHEAERVLTDQEPHLSHLTSWPEWERWRDAVVARYRRQGQHCPLGVLVTELRRTSPAAQEITAQLIRQWQDAIAAGVRAMQAQREISASVQPDRAAAALVAGIQGGVLVLLATGRSTHLEAALDQGLDYLRRVS